MQFLRKPLSWQSFYFISMVDLQKTWQIHTELISQTNPQTSKQPPKPANKQKQKTKQKTSNKEVTFTKDIEPWHVMSSRNRNIKNKLRNSVWPDYLNFFLKNKLFQLKCLNQVKSVPEVLSR